MAEELVRFATGLQEDLRSEWPGVAARARLHLRATFKRMLDGRADDLWDAAEDALPTKDLQIAPVKPSKDKHRAAFVALATSSDRYGSGRDAFVRTWSMRRPEPIDLDALDDGELREMFALVTPEGRSTDLTGEYWEKDANGKKKRRLTNKWEILAHWFNTVVPKLKPKLEAQRLRESANDVKREKYRLP